MKTCFSPFNLQSVIHPERTWFLSVAVFGSLLAIGCINQTVGAESVVQIRDNFFSPRRRNIAPNDSVRWVNQGNNPHTATSDTGLWHSGTLNHGEAFSVTFSTVGSFPYFCQIHGQAMSGTINVTTNGSAVLGNLFLVTVSGNDRSTNALGKIVSTPEKTRDLVADCARDHQLNPANLSLVYDRQADAIKVVQNSDGLTVCTMITFVGGANVIAADGRRKERQAFVFWEDSQEANGSMVGTETVTRDAGGALLKFSLRGSIQFGLEMHEDEPPSVFQGTFSTGRQFVPRM